MGVLAHKFREILEYGLGLFDALSPFWALTLISCLTGIIMLWFVGLTTPQRRVEVARSRIAAAIYETRLFIDSPRRIVASQGRLLGWLMVYLAYLTPAFIVLSLPLGLLYLHLDARHGLAPLPVNEPVVVRVQLDAGVDGYAVQPGPDMDSNIEVTAPPIYIENEQRVYVRVMIKAPGVYSLPVQVGERVVHKRLVADPGAAMVSPEARSGMALWWAVGLEPPLEHGVVAISVSHPDKPQRWLGTGMPWWLYWLGLSTIVALAARRPMGVVI
jgi:hypothetical protein